MRRRRSTLNSTRRKRDTLITFQRATMETDDYGEDIATWAAYASEWAAVRFGSAQERREAAQESASQTATFRVLANSLTRSLTPLDRISSYLGAAWDITGVALMSAAEIEITAVRKAG